MLVSTFPGGVTYCFCAQSPFKILGWDVLENRKQSFCKGNNGSENYCSISDEWSRICIIKNSNRIRIRAKKSLAQQRSQGYSQHSVPRQVSAVYLGSASHRIAAVRVCPRIGSCAVQIPLVTTDEAEWKKICRKAMGMIKRTEKHSGRKQLSRQRFVSLEKTSKGGCERDLEKSK